MTRLGRRSFLAATAATTVSAGLAARPARAEGDTIKLGNIVTTSGPLKTVGEPAMIVAQMAVAEINAAGGVNGRKLELIRYDTASDPSQAAVAARKLVEDDGVLALVGPFSSGETQVAMNVAERAHVVMMPNAASVPGLSNGKKYLWRLAQDEAIQFRRLLTSMKAHDILPKSAAILYISDEAVDADAGKRIYPALLTEFGVSVTPSIAIQYKTFDMAPQVAKVLEGKPDAVALAALTPSAAKVIQELRKQGFEGRIIGSQLFADPTNVRLFGPAGNGVLYMTGFWMHESPQSEKFTADFLTATKAAGMDKLGPFHTDAQTYDIVYLLKQAMEKAQVTGDPAKVAAEREAIRDAISGIRFTGILGRDICFNGQDATLPGYVIELKDQQWTLFDTAPAAACKTAA